MSKVKIFVSNEELIVNAIDAIWTACGDRCIEKCDCAQIATLLKERFLNV